MNPGLAPFRPIQPRKPQHLKEKTMIATITIAGTVAAQGPLVQNHADGRVTIDGGVRKVTDWPIGRVMKGALSALALAIMGLGVLPAPVQASARWRAKFRARRSS